MAQETIQAGMEAVVIAKMNTSGVLLAVLVVLCPAAISGQLIAISPEAGGSDLTLDIDTDGPEVEEVHVFLPGNVLPHIKGDGLIPLDLLRDQLS